MKTINILFIACILFFTASCSTNGRPLEELYGDAAAADLYRAKEGDVLKIDVWGEPKVSGSVTVRSDGKFTMPLVKNVEAAGLTLDEITTDIAEKLKKFIPAASVSISVERSAPIKYYLSGAFLKPGSFMSNTSITLLQAITTGSGFAPFANESSILLIRNRQGGQIRYELDYNRVLDGKEPNPALRDGDVIAVR